jgi:hypothetical protein
MLLVIFTIFSPVEGWHRAAEAGRSAGRFILLHLVPLILIGCAAEGYGMLKWGKRIGDFGAVRDYAQPEVIRYQALWFAVLLAVVVLSAMATRVMGNTFHTRQTFQQTLTLTTIGLGPIFLLRALDALPAMNPWIAWGIAAVLVMAVLYQGVPAVMSPDPAHAIGLYFSTAIVLVMASGVGRLLMVGVLQGRIPGLAEWVFPPVG